MRAKFVYESLVGDVLKPKTRDQIINDLSKLSQEDKNIKLLGASENGQKDVVELLLLAGADVNAIDMYGWTPLIGASRYGHKDIVELLLKGGADVNAIDKYGRTPLILASWYGRKDIVTLLKKYGAKN